MAPVGEVYSAPNRFFPAMICFAILVVSSEGASAKSSGPALRARASLSTLVRLAAMQADYGQAVVASTDRNCRNDNDLVWITEAALASDGFPLDPQRLCLLPTETHVDGNTRTITVQARSGSSCENFQSSLKRFISKNKSIPYLIMTSDSIRIQDSGIDVSQAANFYRLKRPAIACTGTSYSVTFERRGFFY